MVSKNQFVLNLNKACVLIFPSSKLPTYNNQSFTVVETITFLGLPLDSHLTWKLHLKGLLKKTEFCLLHDKKTILHT